MFHCNRLGIFREISLENATFSHQKHTAALGAERDRNYDKYLKRTVRPRVHGGRCFNLSLSLFAAEASLVLLERTFCRSWFVWVLATTVGTLWYLYRDWRLILRMAEYIYKD